MEIAKHILVLIIGITLATVSVQSAEQQQTKLSNTRQASCLVKVSCDPVVLPLSLETIDFLLHSSGIEGKALHDALDISPDHVRGSFFAIGNYLDGITSNATPKTSTGSSSQHDDEEQAHLFSLTVHLPPDVKPAAEEFMDAVLFYFRNALTSAFNEHVQKLKHQLELADEEAERAEQDLNTKQKDLLSNFGSRILDRARILADMENIRKDIEKVKMEQAADQANIDETTRQITKIKTKMQEEIDKDTVTKELLKIIDLNMMQLHDTKKLVDAGQGPAAQNDVAEALEKLTKSRIELAQRREQLSRSAGGNLIDSLNSQLTDYAIKAAQNQAKLSNLKHQLEGARLLLEKANAYELLSLKIDIAKQNLQETILWRDRISRKVRIIQPPLVSVVGGD